MQDLVPTFILPSGLYACISVSSSRRPRKLSTATSAILPANSSHAVVFQTTCSVLGVPDAPIYEYAHPNLRDPVLLPHLRGVTGSIIRLASHTSPLATSPGSDSASDGDEMATLTGIHPTKHQMKKGLLEREIVVSVWKCCLCLELRGNSASVCSIDRHERCEELIDAGVVFPEVSMRGSCHNLAVSSDVIVLS